MKVGDLVKIKISDDIYKPNRLEDKIGVLIKRAPSRPATLEETMTKNDKWDKYGNVQLGPNGTHERAWPPGWHVLVLDTCVILSDNDLRVMS